MPRYPTRPGLALLGALALLGLAACGRTVPCVCIPTPISHGVALAPTPTNVPAGWKVLAGWHYSLAYPPGWTPYIDSQQEAIEFDTMFSDNAPAAMRVSIRAYAPDAYIETTYCQPASGDIQHTTLAGLPMSYMLNFHIVGQPQREWTFANAQRTIFTLSFGDAQASSATLAQDDVILATFRPDNATPWQC